MISPSPDVANTWFHCCLKGQYHLSEGPQQFITCKYFKALTQAVSQVVSRWKGNHLAHNASKVERFPSPLHKAMAGTNLTNPSGQGTPLSHNGEVRTSLRHKPNQYKEPSLCSGTSPKKWGEAKILFNGGDSSDWLESGILFTGADSIDWLGNTFYQSGLKRICSGQM